MSGGQSEARALESDVRAVERAAAALREALEDATVGFHGVRVAESEILDTVNEVLRGSRWRVTNLGDNT